MSDVGSHRSQDELKADLGSREAAPRDTGSLEMIVVRPDTGTRHTPAAATLDVDDGLVGDRWSNGTRNPEAQVTLINATVLDVVSGGRRRWELAGDNLVVDLDISEANLPPGQRIEVGAAILEISVQLHTGCEKFASRFGADALRFVNIGEGKVLRYRGVNARVVRSGSISVGDAAIKR